MEIKGKIAEFREFCLHDGPGVRTTLFFQGCPMRCRWCHNPELLSASGGREYTVKEAAEKILKDRDILLSSGGGVTFSGGEVLMQTGFAARLAAALPDIHIAVETSGFAAENDYRTMLGFADLIFQDIKVFFPERHRELTGCSNENILQNIRQLQTSGKPFIIRIPVVPGLNDAVENLSAIARFLTEDPGNLQEIQLLAYHGAAVSKRKKLNLPIPPELPRMDGVIAPELPEIFRTAGLPCRTFQLK